MKLFLARIQDNTALITSDEAHHMHRVLRLDQGDEVFVTDGKGLIFKGIIQSLDSKVAVVSSLNQIENFQKRNYKIEIAVAPTKQIDRIEYLLEKAIEIGLDGFFPMITFHSERRKINHDRLERIALSAMKQSLKADLTQIHPLMTFEEIIHQNLDASCHQFIAHCHPDIEVYPIKSVINSNQSYRFLIGPEGDFSKEEVQQAIKLGYTPVSLGNQRMRTETAALSCVMLTHFLHI
ncbi:MAG: RsmE family RNA methyltransferase [Flavobacteriaceae bacterium]|nr:RsmE family RNA methyltransferase [Flavobacteriaceae bacterium]